MADKTADGFSARLAPAVSCACRNCPAPNAVAVPGNLGPNRRRNFQKLLMAVSGLALSITLPSIKLKAANSVVVPWRLQSWVIVPHRPFFNGKFGLCPIQRLNLALLINTQYQCLLADSDTNPPIGQLLQQLPESRDSLKVRLRCGLRLCNCQSRLTVFLLTPWPLAISRQLQWVIPLGLVCKVAAIRRRSGTGVSAICLSRPALRSPRPRRSRLPGLAPRHSAAGSGS